MATVKDYESTVMRVAGNIASGYVLHPEGTLAPDDIAQWAVKVARAIVAEVQRTKPAESK